MGGWSGECIISINSLKNEVKKGNQFIEKSGRCIIWSNKPTENIMREFWGIGFPIPWMGECIYPISHNKKCIRDSNCWLVWGGMYMANNANSEIYNQIWKISLLNGEMYVPMKWNQKI